MGDSSLIGRTSEEIKKVFPADLSVNSMTFLRTEWFLEVHPRPFDGLKDRKHSARSVKNNNDVCRKKQTSAAGILTIASLVVVANKKSITLLIYSNDS